MNSKIGTYLGYGLLAFFGFVILAGLSGRGTSPKCGEIGYYPKLTEICRAAQTSIGVDVHVESHCSADELADIKCAAATYAENGRQRDEEWKRRMTERTY